MGLETAFEVGQMGLDIKRIADTLVASQKDVFVRLPGLLAYYPMGIRNASGLAIDHSNAGANLLQQGLCPTGYDGNSFAHLGDGTNYLYGSASNQITGLETYISSSLRGLTLGGWFMIDSAPAVAGGLLSRSDDTPDRGYFLVQTNSGEAWFVASGTGAAVVQVLSATYTIGVWRFIVGRFTPSTEVAVFVDGDKNTSTVAIPASLNVSAQAFEVGRYYNDNTRIVHGKARDVFVCAASLSDALIEEIRVTSVP